MYGTGSGHIFRAMIKHPDSFVNITLEEGRVGSVQPYSDALWARQLFCRGGLSAGRTLRRVHWCGTMGPRHTVRKLTSLSLALDLSASDGATLSSRS